MISVKGKFKNGVALPLEPVEKSHEETKEVLSGKTNAAKSLEDLIAECEIDTGIADLAKQHGYYLCNKTKITA